MAARGRDALYKNRTCDNPNSAARPSEVQVGFEPTSRSFADSCVNQLRHCTKPPVLEVESVT